jgi:hypothetical protein
MQNKPLGSGAGMRKHKLGPIPKVSYRVKILNPAKKVFLKEDLQGL